MPEKYSYYVGNDSGGDENGYPHNAKRMVEDAVSLTLEKDKSIKWNDYDLNGDGMVDALFVVHAGPGAEVKGTPAEELNISGRTNGQSKILFNRQNFCGIVSHST